MEPDLIAVWLRGSERLLISFSGMVSLVMGWNLFKVGIVDPQTGELKGKSWSVKLQKCGPGIFFAAFGTGILLWSINKKMVIEAPEIHVAKAAAPSNSGRAPDVITVSKQISWLGENNAGQKELAQSINYLEMDWDEQKAQLHASDPLQAERIKRMDRAMSQVEEVRNSILIAKFGSAAMADYGKNKKLVQQKGPNAISQEDQEKLKPIDEWMKPLEPKQ